MTKRQFAEKEFRYYAPRVVKARAIIITHLGEQGFRRWKETLPEYEYLEWREIASIFEKKAGLLQNEPFILVSEG